MTSVQRLIKYFAIAFAIFLIFSIISGITVALSSISNIFTGKENTTIIDTKELSSLSSYLNINLKRATLNIKKGDKFYVEVSSDDIKINEEDNRITIEDKTKIGILSFKRETVNLYIPEDYKYDLVSINNGAGSLNINYLNTKKLVLDLGAGKTVIDNIYSDESKIDTGAGSFRIINGELNNATIDVGVGKLEIKAKLSGNNKIEAGIGSINLELIDNDYNLHLSKGIGSITLNGDSIKNDANIGSGSNTIDISGGIGSIKINVLK